VQEFWRPWGSQDKKFCAPAKEFWRFCKPKMPVLRGSGKSPNPADTFRTVNYAVDRRGEELILESKDPGNVTIFRYPYVAKVFSGDGRYANNYHQTQKGPFSPQWPT